MKRELLADDQFVQNLKSDLRQQLTPVLGEVLKRGREVGLNTRRIKETVLIMMDASLDNASLHTRELAQKAAVTPEQMRSFELRMCRELLDEVLGE